MASIVPCFPSSKARVVEPEPVVHKNVHRYGETSIRHLDTRPRDQWKKTNKYEGRQLPRTPRTAVEAEPHQLRRQPEAHLSSRTYSKRQKSAGSQQAIYDAPWPSYQAPAPPRGEVAVRHRPPKPRTADFYVSVPIFHESMNHSYRKKNVYVYRDKPNDSDALYHQSLTRASSIHSLDRTGHTRPHSGRPDSYKKYSSRRRPHSADVDRYYDNRYGRSANMFAQTLPADMYTRPRSHLDAEYWQPYSAQMDKHRPTDNHRRSRKHKNPQPVDKYYRSREPGDDYYGPVYMKQRPRSHHRSPGKRRHKSTSEMSYDSRLSARSYGSVYSYESERFDPAVRLKKAPSSIGISIDSDDEDRR